MADALRSEAQDSALRMRQEERAMTAKVHSRAGDGALHVAHQQPLLVGRVQKAEVHGGG